MLSRILFGFCLVRFVSKTCENAVGGGGVMQNYVLYFVIAIANSHASFYQYSHEKVGFGINEKIAVT